MLQAYKFKCSRDVCAHASLKKTLRFFLLGVMHETLLNGNFAAGRCRLH